MGNSNATPTASAPPGVDLEKLPSYTWEEVREHADVKDLWIVIAGLVYNVTAYQFQHPGGPDVLFRVARELQHDGTAEFEYAQHSEDALGELKRYVVGKLAVDSGADETDNSNGDAKNLEGGSKKSSATPSSQPPASTTDSEGQPSTSGAQSNGSSTPSGGGTSESTSHPQLEGVTILFGTEKGTCDELSLWLLARVQQRYPGLSARRLNLATVDPEDLPKHSRRFLVFVVPTYDGGHAPPIMSFFAGMLRELAVDHRVPDTFLNSCYGTVFGIGNSLYPERVFNKYARTMKALLQSLGMHVVGGAVGVGDVSNSRRLLYGGGKLLSGGGKLLSGDSSAESNTTSTNTASTTTTTTTTSTSSNTSGDTRQPTPTAGSSAGAGLTVSGEEKEQEGAGGGSEGSIAPRNVGPQAGPHSLVYTLPQSSSATRDLSSRESQSVDSDLALWTQAVLWPWTDTVLARSPSTHKKSGAGGKPRKVVVRNENGAWEGEHKGDTSAAVGGSFAPSSDGGSGGVGASNDNINSTLSTSESQLVDVEDIGQVHGKPDPYSKEARKARRKAARAQRKLNPVEEKVQTYPSTVNSHLPQMLNPRQRRNLKKSGYKLIGSHSGVKLCRWTKAMLRGRGGCYKHTFYGIASYQCMEMTPSLACANKCTYCWRGLKQPTATSWTYEMQEAKYVFEQACAEHRKMIKEFRGAPGVKPERAREAMTIRHCALSLVGEPIMYPQINEFLKYLHHDGISTFLVTNAQFPERMRNLDPVTQLYISVDAASPEELKAVDRPLFQDFWSRYLECMKAIRLVKGDDGSSQQKDAHVVKKLTDSLMQGADTAQKTDGQTDQQEGQGDGGAASHSGNGAASGGGNGCQDAGGDEGVCCGNKQQNTTSDPSDGCCQRNDGDSKGCCRSSQQESGSGGQCCTGKQGGDGGGQGGEGGCCNKESGEESRKGDCCKQTSGDQQTGGCCQQQPQSLTTQSETVKGPSVPEERKEITRRVRPVGRRPNVRTVYRMTLVKGFNMSRASDYARLVMLGLPTFIEIKGVTFCGSSTGSTITMKNVPFHEEVVAFAQTLCSALDDTYELACVHAHSCCVLLATTDLKFVPGSRGDAGKRTGGEGKSGGGDGENNGTSDTHGTSQKPVWHTWIDYPKWTALVKRYYEQGTYFSYLDYCAPTPSWAVWGADEQGFDPEETRFFRNNRKDVSAIKAAALAKLPASQTDQGDQGASTVVAKDD